jgi:hypothetical protein
VVARHMDEDMRNMITMMALRVELGSVTPESVWLSEPQQDLVTARARDSCLPMNGTWGIR